MGMFNAQRTIDYKGETFSLSLWDIWKKLHVNNEFSKMDNNKETSWKISTKFKIIFRVCFPCYALVLLVVYVGFVIDLTIEPSGNIWLVLINFIILCIPLLLIELLLALFVPLQYERVDTFV